MIRIKQYREVDLFMHLQFIDYLRNKNPDQWKRKYVFLSFNLSKSNAPPPVTRRIPNRKLATETSSNNQHRKWNHLLRHRILTRFGNQSMLVRLLQNYTGRRARRCSRSRGSAATSSDSLTTKWSRISPATPMVSTADRGLKATVLTRDLKKETGTCSLSYCYFVLVQGSSFGWNSHGYRLELPLALYQDGRHCWCRRCSH